MMESMRWLLGLLVLLAVVAGGLFLVASRGSAPSITIEKPDRVVGQSGTLDVTVATPNGRLSALNIQLDQNGKTVPLFSLTNAGGATLTQVDREHVHVSRAFGKKGVPELQQGAARIMVTASRTSFLNLRTFTGTASK